MTNNKMKRISSLLTLFICVFAVALAQFHDPVSFSTSQKKVGDDVLEVIFQGSVDAGWHVYGTDFADGGLTLEDSTKVATWLAEDGVALIEVSGGSIIGRFTGIRAGAAPAGARGRHR